MTIFWVNSGDCFLKMSYKPCYNPYKIYQVFNPLDGWRSKLIIIEVYSASCWKYQVQLFLDRLRKSLTNRNRSGHSTKAALASKSGDKGIASVEILERVSWSPGSRKSTWHKFYNKPIAEEGTAFQTSIVVETL